MQMIVRDYYKLQYTNKIDNIEGIKNILRNVQPSMTETGRNRKQEQIHCEY